MTRGPDYPYLLLPLGKISLPHHSTLILLNHSVYGTHLNHVMATSKTPKLEDQGERGLCLEFFWTSVCLFFFPAATAELYVTRPERSSQQKGNYPLDDNKKISSAGKYNSFHQISMRMLTIRRQLPRHRSNTQARVICHLTPRQASRI